MSYRGEPGQPGKPGEPGTGGGGRGGTGGAGGRGGAADRVITKGARYAVTFLFCFTLLLFGANLVFAAHEVNGVRAVTTAAARNEATIRQLCVTGNELRAQQIILWSHLVAISKPPPHESIQARTARIRTTRDFLAYIRRVFAPRACHPVP